MKFFRLDLLTLLISLFILNSCKNESSIGLGVTAATQLSGSLIDTSTIIVNTIPEDSVITSGLSSTPLSYLKDPLFGTTESNIAMDLSLPNNTGYDSPPGAVTVDSALLVLRYAPGFYGDSIASKYKVNVYQLNERVFSTSLYNNKKQWSYNNSTLLGTKTFFARPSDTIKIVNPVAGIPDTAVKVPPQLRIPLDPNFIYNVLFNAPAGQRASNLVFKNNVKGLYVTLDKNQPGPGGTFMLALDSAAGIQIYYKYFDGSVVDTSILLLPSNVHAAQIKHTYTSTIQTELNNATTGGRKVVYLQGLGGLRAKISFPYIKNLISSLGANVVVNRAELVVTPNPGSTIPFAPLAKLAMYRYDIANQRILVQDDAQGDPRSFGVSGFGGFYSSTRQSYNFLITAYIQDLLRGATTDTGTFIGPIEPALTNTIAATAQTDGRTFAVGFDKTSPYRIKLNLYYTKIPK